jgi:hypothetical protein
MRMVLPMLAAAPMAKKRARIAAAAGMERGSVADSELENRSMMRPIVKGIDRDTAEDTNS